MKDHELGTADESQFPNVAPVNIIPKIAVLAELVHEVRDWHCDPESSEYNNCERNPCAWCEAAIKALAR